MSLVELAQIISHNNHIFFNFYYFIPLSCLFILHVFTILNHRALYIPALIPKHSDINDVWSWSLCLHLLQLQFTDLTHQIMRSLLSPSHFKIFQDRVARGLEKGAIRGKMLVSLISRTERSMRYIHCELTT